MNKEYIAILSALLTPLIAIITAFIAYQQHKNARLKLKHDLYDKRLSIFKIAVQFASAIWRSSGITSNIIKNFTLDITESYFLFEEDMFDYLISLRDRANRLLEIEETIKYGKAEDREKLLAEADELRKSFGRERPVLRKKFAKYLDLRSLR